MTTTRATTPDTEVMVDHEELISFATTVFRHGDVPSPRARRAAEALCHGDLTGTGSHGLVNLTRLHLPSLVDGRVDPVAEPETVRDLGACALVDARRALGLWQAGEAMDDAVERAGRHGVGLVSVRNATHFGCAGVHAVRAARRGMVGLVAANCGRQRIAAPPGGLLPMLGTNPLSVAAPAGAHPPFVLDMSTTVVPTGRIRAVARAGGPIPAGWLAGAHGEPVRDPAAFDRGEAHLLWLGGGSDTGAYKGFGLGVTVEVLAALVSGAGTGPVPAALDGEPSGRDDDIGLIVLAIDPDLLRGDDGFGPAAETLFDTLLACPPRDGAAPPRYPGWPEAQRAERARRDGVALPVALFDELCALAGRIGVPAPEAR